jgi:hypothetical protein
MNVATEGQFVIDQPRDRPFNPFRIPSSRAAHAIAAEVLNEFQNYESYHGLRKRKRRPADQATLKAMIDAIVADLIHRALTVPDGAVAVGLSHRVLGRRTRYGSPVLSKALPHVLNCLVGLEFVKLQKGQTNAFPGLPHIQSTMRAAWRLTSRIEKAGLRVTDVRLDKGDESIVLKADKKGPWDGGEWLSMRTPRPRTCIGRR